MCSKFRFRSGKFWKNNFQSSWTKFLWDFSYFFSTRSSFPDTDNSQESRGRERVIFIPLYHFFPLENIHSFATLHVRWLPRIFNCITCNCQTAIRWDLLPYGICIWMIIANVDFSCTWWFYTIWSCSKLSQGSDGFELVLT